MNRIERYVHLLVALLLAALCLFLAFRLGQTRDAQARTEAALQVQLSKSQAEILELGQEVADLKGALLVAKAARPASEAGPHTLLVGGELTELRAQGLQDPVADLVQALEARTDLIPYPGTLGGTMRFDPPQNWVVSHPWILASFSDGHTGGRALFRYTVQNGKVSFTLVESVRW